MPPQTDGLAEIESHCLSLLLAFPQLAPEVLEDIPLSAEAFQDVQNREVFQRLFLNPEKPLENAIAELDKELRLHVESLLQKLQGSPSLSLEMVREDLRKSLLRLQRHHLSRLISQLRFVQEDAQQQGTLDLVREISAKIDQLRREYLQIDQRYYAATLTGRKK